MQRSIVIKISGHQLSDSGFLQEFAEVIRAIPQPVIIVHGGGTEITQMQERLGLEPHYVDGLRVTDAETLAMVEMVLCGVVNKRLVRHLVNIGVNAMGVSGVDQGAIRAEQFATNMAFTGKIAQVREDVIQGWLAQNIVPVIAPVCIGVDSNFNVNADSVASAIAVTIHAERTIFVSNVAGVLVDGQVQMQLTVSQAEKMIADGIVFGGMIPKVQAVLEIIEAGVPEVMITDLTGLKAQQGTTFVPDTIEVY